MSARSEQAALGPVGLGARALSGRGYVIVASMFILAIAPVIVNVLNEPFYLDLITRLMIFAIAAVSLDIIIGYGGMISFGHAAYLGIGGYAVGIFSYYGVDNGFVQFPVAIIGSALVAVIIGAISLRTSGMYFIMITLAFTQMLYFLGISLETYGGDDGMTTNRSEFAGIVDLYDPNTFYYLVFVLLVLVLYGSYRLINSRFGMVIRGARSNGRRMRAIGFPTVRYQLVAFTISGAILRRCRRVARQPHRVRYSRIHALDAFGRTPVHGDIGWDGHIVWRGFGNGGLPNAGGGSIRLHAALAYYSRPGPDPGRAVREARYFRRGVGQQVVTKRPISSYRARSAIASARRTRQATGAILLR